MRNFIALLTVMTFGLFTTSLSAQNADEPMFAIVDYMKVAPGMGEEYRACESAWKILHQQRVDAGEIESWELESVVYSGINEEYNYLTITVVIGWNAIEDQPMDFGKFIESIPADQRKYIQNPNEYRTWVRREIWRVQDAILPSDGNWPEYRVENFSKVGPKGWYAQMSMEKDFAKPVIEHRIKSDKQAGWVLANLFRSRGSAYPYNISTVDFYDKWEDITASGRASWEAIHPHLTYGQVEDMIYDAKTPVRSEIRRLVDHTN